MKNYLILSYQDHLPTNRNMDLISVQIKLAFSTRNSHIFEFASPTKSFARPRRNFFSSRNSTLSLSVRANFCRVVNSGVSVRRYGRFPGNNPPSASSSSEVPSAIRHGVSEASATVYQQVLARVEGMRLLGPS